jgi:type VI secretion system protein ImpF
MSGRSGRIGRLGEDGSSIELPLIDRLIDDSPDTVRERPLPPAETMAVLRRSVRRDLEALLNARRRWRSWPSELAELAVSPIGYGISDFSAGAFNDPARRDELRLEVEETIRRFEPRLTHVSVAAVDSADGLEATLRLRIEAMLRAEPAPEPIAFDTLVDATTAEVQVRATAGDPGRSSGDV